MRTLEQAIDHARKLAHDNDDFYRVVECDCGCNGYHVVREAMTDATDPAAYAIVTPRGRIIYPNPQLSTRLPHVRQPLKLGASVIAVAMHAPAVEAEGYRHQHGTLDQRARRTVEFVRL